jgi:L-threonate 2-dehydrogenase
MKARPTIGIISPGDMGHAIGAVLVQHGLHVLTNLQGRSARTVALARQAGITDVSDDETLVREADMLLSVLVPAQAYAFAERIAVAMCATGSTPLFADCNAISPRTVRSIERLLREVGAEVVDVGIIGAPLRAGRAETRLYASGPGAQRLAILGEYGLDVRVIGPQVGRASGLKMCYASLTKGLNALAIQALAAGEVLGLSETLIGELRESQAELLGWFERQVPRMPPKAYRWVGEMGEIAYLRRPGTAAPDAGGGGSLLPAGGADGVGHGEARGATPGTEPGGGDGYPGRGFGEGAKAGRMMVGHWSSSSIGRGLCFSVSPHRPALFSAVVHTTA